MVAFSLYERERTEKEKENRYREKYFSFDNTRGRRCAEILIQLE